MSDTSEPNLHLKTVAIVLVVALIILGIQSCQESHPGTFSDKQIMQVGRNRFLLKLGNTSKIEIIQESVVRPGRNGGDFGYLIRYRAPNADGERVEKEHYDE
jgi:hypothetical protein